MKISFIFLSMVIIPLWTVPSLAVESLWTAFEVSATKKETAGNFAEAAKLHQSAAAETSKSSRKFESLCRAAKCLRETKNYSESDSLLAEALTLTTSGDATQIDGKQKLDAQLTLGLNKTDEGNLVEAEAALSAALHESEKTGQPTDALLTAMASVYEKQGKSLEAEALRSRVKETSRIAEPAAETVHGEQGNLLILMDCSYSMRQASPLSSVLDGHESSPGEEESKLDYGKAVAERVIARMSADTNVGLRVFGQSLYKDPYIDCQQTALLVPLGAHNRKMLLRLLGQIKPIGLSPLTYALREAANDLARQPGPKAILLITKGDETCGYDPCMEVRRIVASGIKIKIDVLGLYSNRAWESKNQLTWICQ